MTGSTDPDVRLLQGAADPTRLRMLRQLSMGGAVCACDFTADGMLSQPTISHHLRVLRESGWVTTERRGTWIWYSLRPEAAERFARLADVIGPVDNGASTRLRSLPVVDMADRSART